MSEGSTLHILDGAYFAHRSWHRKGRPPLENYVHLLLRLIQRETPSHFVVAWESEGDTFRHEIYEGYKAHRPDHEPELIEHIRRCRNATESLGVPVVAIERLEGDDVAASFAAQWAELGHNAVVHTADKDLLQLVTDDVRVAIRKYHHRHDDVVERMGVKPEQVPDLLALAGDTADGIPGVPGIGPQTAAKYLSIWNTIDGIFENRHHLSEKKRASLWEARDSLKLFRELTRVRRDAELPIRLEDTYFVPRMDALLRFCEANSVHRIGRIEGYDDVRYELDERVAIMLESGVDHEKAVRMAVHSVRTRHDPFYS